MENISLSIDDKIKSLLNKFGVTKELVITHDEDKPMVLMALQQPDIETVNVDDEGGLEITYTGSEWYNNEQGTI